MELPPRDPRAAYRRKVIAIRRIGNGRKCACGESRPEAMIPGCKSTLCYACDRRLKVRRATDDHHIAGQANDPTKISVPVNDHRAELSVAQQDWPPKTLQNPDESQLLTAAARIRGFVDTSIYLMQRFLLPGATLLEQLDTNTKQKPVRKRDKNTKLKTFEPKSKSDT